MGYASIISLHLLLFLFSSLVLSQQSCIHDNSTNLDISALLAFKKGILIDPHNVLGNWSESAHVCDWNGVWCNICRERVTHLDLHRSSLVGKISPFLSNLSFLAYLDLSGNHLHGPILKDLGALANLNTLDLEENEIRDFIPDSFGVLTNLSYINIRSNWLHGRLPTPVFYNCTKLEVINLSENFLSGPIPPQIGNHLLDLEHLILYNNKLTDSIPASLANATKMQNIDLEDNLLTEMLSSDIFIHMPHLTGLRLSYNYPLSNDSNSNLNPFFSSISNLTQLKYLELAGNNLRGDLPSIISRLPFNLSLILLQDNQIHGSIPSTISKLFNLWGLNLENNDLNGTIPPELLLLPKLQSVWVSKNSLHGEIPSLPSVKTNLGLLDLSCNELSGPIPASLANLNQLSVLNLHDNFLSGPIPSNLGTLNLEQLDLSHNRLTGVIPSKVASLSTMEIYFNLSNNLLEGEIPMEMSKMAMVQTIDLSSNNFSGTIPPVLENCKAVKLLNLSHNFFHGLFPASIANLPNIQSLDVSSNFLSGEIPYSLQNCTSLKQLNLSFNNFSGKIPEGGVFDGLTYDSIKGNHLCGSLPGVPNCQHRQQGITFSHRFLVLILSTVCVSFFLLAIILAGSCMLIRSGVLQRTDGNSSLSSLDLVVSYQRITYRELLEATEAFNHRNLIGSGSFGHVYRGVLRDGSVVAIKALQLCTSDSDNNFNRECQILKRIRHRNLIRIISACSLPGFKALVLPFMVNGSLESHLYHQTQDSNSKHLSLIERVNVSYDVAQGMAYLHHHAPVQIIHCDLKPSNILLNDDMTALVSDFGIARLGITPMEKSMASANTTNTTTDLLCGSIGYIAPEYGYGRAASTKGDVYSFGILVLEILTRKKPTDEIFREGLSLQKWVKNHYQGQLDKVIDPSLTINLQAQTPEVREICEIAIVQLLDLSLLCSQAVPSTRPTMIYVADELEEVKHYLSGDVTFASSLGKSSTVIGADDW